MPDRKVNLLAVVRPELKVLLSKLAEQERRSLSNMAALILEEGVAHRLAKQNQQPKGEDTDAERNHNNGGTGATE